MNQFIFILSIYIVGRTYSVLLFDDITDNTKQIISPFLGVSFYSLSIALLYLINVKITIASLFFVLFLIWNFILFFKSKIISYNWSIDYFVVNLKNLLSLSNNVIFSLYFLLALLFIIIGYADATPDSTQFEGLGRFLSQGGTINNRVPYIDFLISGRFLVVASMHCINRLFGSYSLYTLNPTLAFWFLGSIGFFFFSFISDLPNRIKIILISTLIVSISFFKHFYNFVFDIHSNTITMVFFSLSIIAQYLYCKLNLKSWLYLGSFFIGMATLVRIEMLMFSMIFFIILSNIVNNNYYLCRNCWMIFLSTALPWRIFTIHLISKGSFYASSHEILLTVFVILIFCVFSLLLTKINYSITWFLKGCYVFLFLLLFILLILYPNKIDNGFNIFLKYWLMGHDAWLLFSLSFLVYFFD